MHVVEDYPVTAPNKAFFFKNADNFVAGCPALFKRNHHPFVTQPVFFPAPVNRLAAQPFGEKVNGDSVRVKRFPGCAGNFPPIVGIRAFQSVDKFFYFWICFLGEDFFSLHF